MIVINDGAGDLVDLRDYRELEEQLAQAKALLARVFQDQCDSNWLLIEGQKVWKEGCMLRCSERGYCNMTDYKDAAEVGRRADCPYLKWEDKK
jgi:hypothetical protein